MRTIQDIFEKQGLAIVLATLVLASLGGCSGDGPAIEARPQSIGFSAAPQLPQGGGATVSAAASSGLAVSYSSITPAVCSVDGGTGVVTAHAVGNCVIAAHQSGNTHFAPAPQVTQTLPVLVNPGQSIGFGAAPPLSLGGTASVSATASSGLPVTFSSRTPAVCSVDAKIGLVTDLTTGVCTVAADQAGNANFNPAPQATQTLSVSAPSRVTVPVAPTGVSATAGSGANTVSVTIGATDSGGSPITGYTVISRPTGISATGTDSPIAVTCPSGCAGYAFAAVASNALGDGAPSAFSDVVTTYQVTETFSEPDTQPKNTMFIGSFDFDATAGTVSNLHGVLSETMTGGASAYPNDTMTWLTLGNQLSSVPATLGGANGLLVTTFLLNSTNTLSNNPVYHGTDGWSPGTGMGLYYGFPSAPSPGAGGVGNAYARIFVNSSDPTAPLTQAQIDSLAYADCTAGGMMGGTCMTGTTLAGYGTVGTMSGYPVSQIITKP